MLCRILPYIIIATVATLVAVAGLLFAQLLDTTWLRSAAAGVVAAGTAIGTIGASVRALGFLGHASAGPFDGLVSLYPVSSSMVTFVRLVPRHRFLGEIIPLSNLSILNDVPTSMGDDVDQKLIQIRPAGVPQQSSESRLGGGGTCPPSDPTMTL